MAPSRMMDKSIEKDPSYSNHGIKFISHFARMEEMHEFIQIQASIFLGKEMYELEAEEKAANWLSSKVEAKAAIKVEKGSFIDISKEGLIIRKAENYQKSPGFDYVYPNNESIAWLDDFYSRAWESDLEERLFLLI